MLVRLSRRTVIVAIAGLLLVILMGGLRSAAIAALEPGTSAIVRADGDCLRMRGQPGLTNTTIVTCIPDGSVVSVLAGSVAVDGLQWQRIQFGGQIGWSVDQYLQPFSGVPAATPFPTAIPVPTAVPGPLPDPALSGTVPTTGFGLAVWSGGPIDRMPPVAAARGCGLRAVWVTVGGDFVGYVFGAPAIVNMRWNERYPDGSLPPSSAVIVVCADGTPPPGPTPIATQPPGAIATPGVPPGMPSSPPGPAGN